MPDADGQTATFSNGQLHTEARLQTLEQMLAELLEKLGNQQQTTPEPGEPEEESSSDENRTVKLEDPSILFIKGSAHLDLSHTATRMFNRLHDTGDYFYRGSEIVKASPSGLEPETPQSLRTTAETIFKQIYKIDNNKDTGGQSLKPTTLNVDITQAIVEARDKKPLREINSIASSPILFVNNGELEVCKKGYARSTTGGGIYVTGGESRLPGSLKEAIELLLEPFEQFDFVEESDRTRALAMAITPALVQAGLIKGHIPIDFGEADQSQSGKGYRHDLVVAIYNEVVTLVTNRKEGVGSLDESIGNAILKGRLFIRLDNMRGSLDSEVLESYITTQPTASVSVRGFRRCEDIRGGQHLFQASSNGMQLTEDAANRSIIIRIRKRPDGFKFNKYPEGYILDHVQANYAKYLGAVHRIVIEWYNRGCPESDTAAHDFRAWGRILDWIMANFFDRPDMLKGHRALQNRISDDTLTMLRHIAVELDRAGRLNGLDEFLSAHELVEILECSNVELKGNDDAKKARVLGSKLSKVFNPVGNESPVYVDGYCVVRHERARNYQGQGEKLLKFYVFYKRQEPNNDPED